MVSTTPWISSAGLSVARIWSIDLLELRNAFQREELALHRHQHGIRRRHRVERQQVERRRAVDQDVVEALVGRACARWRATSADDRVAQPEGARSGIGQRRIEADQVGVGRHDVQARNRRRQRAFEQAGAAGQHVVGGLRPAFDGDAETRRGVALRIEIDDQHALADGGQRRAEIDGRRRLADAALLIGDRQSRGSRPSSRSSRSTLRLGLATPGLRRFGRCSPSGSAPARSSNSHRSCASSTSASRLAALEKQPDASRWKKPGAASSRSRGKGANARAVITSTAPSLA